MNLKNSITELTKKHHFTKCNIGILMTRFRFRHLGYTAGTDRC